MGDNPRWRRYLRFFGRDVAADVGEELEFHLQSKVEDLKREGWAPAQALAEAYRQFGDIGTVRRTCESVAKSKDREMRFSERWSAFLQDVRYGVKQLRRSLGTTFLALISLGIGMGGGTAVFSVIYAVVLRPLPFPAPDQLVSVWSVREGLDDVVTPRNFDAWRRDAHSFQEIGAIQSTTFTLSHAGVATQIAGAFASAGFFRAFGVSPEIGHTFTPEEDRAPRLHLVVLSHKLWQDRFGGDHGVVGRQIYLNREAFTVVGVMPASFSVLPNSNEAWVPLALSSQEMSWAGGVLQVVGRLRGGVTVEQAQAEMNVLARSLEKLYPNMNRRRGIRVRDYASEMTGEYKGRLFILLGAVGFVLLIACANVANLLLARTAGRKQELAVRAALGATRWRVIRQLLTESLLVGMAGAALGLGLSQFLLLSVSKTNLNIPRLNQATLNTPVFLFALGLGLFSTVLAGLLPALRAAHVDIQTVLRQGGRSAIGSARDSARNLYIAGEVALALVLLVGAGLLIRTAMAVQGIKPGFSPAHVITGRTALPGTVYRNAADSARAYGEILRDLREQPGVVNAGLASKVPLTAGEVGLSLKQNAVTPSLKEDVATELHIISDGYLATMGIPLQSGRAFNAYDRDGSEQVALVSNGLAQRLWPHGRPVGQIIRIPELEGRSKGWQVVGVVADVRVNGSMSGPPPVLYLPMRQISTNPWHWIEQSLYLVARTQSQGTSTPGLLRRALNQVDAQLPLGDARTMDQRLAESVALADFYTLVLAGLGGCGLLLTMAGIYGVVAYFVGRQRTEIGIRLALGSSKMGVLLLVVRQGMRPVLLGLVIGLLAAVSVTRVLASELYGVGAADPLTLSTVAAVVFVVALLACFLPAREAANVDPMVALRNE